MAENHHLDQYPPPPDLTRRAAMLLLIGCVLMATWKLVLTSQYTWTTGMDLTDQVLPWLQFQASEWHAGRFPLWEPNQWMGQPLLGQAQPGAAYPLNWILFLTPLRHGWINPNALHWYFFIIHAMAALFAYRFARDLNVSRWGSVFAGCVYSLTGWMARTDWPQMVNGAVWAPLVFMCQFRVLRQERVWRNALLGGFFLGMAWLSGHHQVPIFISLAAGILWAIHLAEHRRFFLPAAVFYGFAITTAALQILPSLEYGKLSVRWVGAPDVVGWSQKVPYTVHKLYSMPPFSLPGVFLPGFAIHSEVYIGITAFALALTALMLRWARPQTRWLTVLGLFGLIYSLGAATLFHGVLYSLVPMVEKARSPHMAIVVFGLAAAMLSGTGLDVVLAQPSDSILRRVRLVTLGLCCLGVAMWIGAVIVRLGTATGDPRSMTALFAGFLFVALLAGWSAQAITARTVALSALGLLLIDVSQVYLIATPHLDETEQVKELRDLRHAGEIADFLRQQPGMPRVHVDNRLIHYNLGDWAGVPQYTGYLASVTANLQTLEHSTAWVQRLMGARFWIGKEAEGNFRQLAFATAGGIKIFQDPLALSRAFIVHRAERVDSAAANRVWMQQHPSDLGEIVTTYDAPPALESCQASESATLTRYEPDHVTIRARLGCKGILVLSDVVYPGWNATVNGKQAQVLQVDGALRGLVLPKGDYTVEYRYQPWSVRLGAASSLLSLAVLLVVLRRTRHHPEPLPSNG